jgi:hypothetical protein
MMFGVAQQEQMRMQRYRRMLSPATAASGEARMAAVGNLLFGVFAPRLMRVCWRVCDAGSAGLGGECRDQQTMIKTLFPTIALGVAIAAGPVRAYAECLFYTGMSALPYSSQPMNFQFCGDIPAVVKTYLHARNDVSAGRVSAFAKCNADPANSEPARFQACIKQIASDFPAPTPTSEVVNFLSRYRLTPEITRALDNPPAYWDGIRYVFAGTQAETAATVAAYKQLSGN